MAGCFILVEFHCDVEGHTHKKCPQMVQQFRNLCRCWRNMISFSQNCKFKIRSLVDSSPNRFTNTLKCRWNSLVGSLCSMEALELLSSMCNASFQPDRGGAREERGGWWKGWCLKWLVFERFNTCRSMLKRIEKEFTCLLFYFCFEVVLVVYHGENSWFEISAIFFKSILVPTCGAC